MKPNRIALVSIFVLILSFMMVGCGGGGGGGGAAYIPSSGGTSTTTNTGLTSVSGTTNSASSDSRSREATQVMEGVVTLTLDSNLNGKFDDKEDLIYTTALENGMFSFDDVVVKEDNVTNAMLTIESEGFATFTKMLELSKDNTVEILAEVGTKPVLTEVIDLSSLRSDARATSFVRFGIREGKSGIESFSQLLSMSEFKALGDLNISDEGTVSESIIPTAAFDKNVKTLTTQLQSFDSSSEEDFAYFPGSLSGHYDSTKRDVSSSGEFPLESAGFDLIKLTDQNGDLIDLQPVVTSKLSSLANQNVCSGMQWTRRLRSGELSIIKAWGDDDKNASNGYQVPIWSNDNSTRSWSYVGLATVYNMDKGNAYFQVCIDKKWQGYLNCDSALSTTRPKQVCVVAKDQFGKLVGGLNISGQKGGNHTYRTLSNYGNQIGTGVLELKDGDINGWNYKYRGALTGWSYIDVEQKSIVTNKAGTDCDYNMTITVDNPYVSKAYVTAFDADAKTPTKNARVHLTSRYYSKYAYTDENGTAVFDIKSDVEYVATYKSGKVTLKADGKTTVGETADNGIYVYGDVKDKNTAPSVYLYLNSYRISDKTETARFSVSARDKDRDSLVFKGLTLDKTSLVEGLDYTVKSRSSYDGYYYINGVLNLNSATLKDIKPSLAAKSTPYALEATFSDVKNPNVSKSYKFYVRKNSAPTINNIYLRTKINGYTRTYYAGSRSIPEGNFSISAYTYDVDGDKVTTTLKLDGKDIKSSSDVLVAKGDHSVVVTAIDANQNKSEKTFKFYVGNHAPVITSVISSKTYVKSGDNFIVYVYAYDAERNPLTLTAKDSKGKEYKFTKMYYNKYQSEPISIDNVIDAKGIAKLKIAIKDDNGNAGTSQDVAVKLNHKPVFDKNATTLSDMKLFTGTTQEFKCVASDPDGTRVTYKWYLNDKLVRYGNSYKYNFTKELDYKLSCIAYDSNRDRESARLDANISVRVNKAPVFTVKLDKTYKVFKGNSESFMCAAQDPEKEKVKYEWFVNGKIQKDGVKTSDTNSTFTYKFDAISSATKVSCKVSDPEGKTATSTAIVSVSLNVPPVFVIKDFPDVTLDINESHTFDCTATDVQGVKYAWMLDGKSTGETTAKVTKMFATASNHTISCTATDGTGLSSHRKANIEVKAANKKPYINDKTLVFSIDANTTKSGKIIFHDDDGTATLKLADGQASVPGLVLNADGSFTYDASSFAKLLKGETKDIYINIVLVDNEGASVEAELHIVVTGIYVAPINHAPTIVTPLHDVSLDKDVAYVFECVANDVDGDTITYKWTVDGVTQKEVGTKLTKSFSDLTTHIVTCTATDGKLSVTSSATVTVMAPADKDKNDSPLVGAWKFGNSSLTPYETVIVIADNQYYFMAQEILGEDGKIGGIEVGSYALSSDKMHFSDAKPLVNTNAGDSIVGETLTYNATNDTVTLKDGTTLTRVHDANYRESGAWIGWISETKFVGLVLDGSKYMFSTVNLSNNSYEPDAKGYRENATEFGSYIVDTDGNFNAIPDAETDFSAVCKASRTVSGCGTVAGDSNGKDGFTSFTNVKVKYLDDDHMLVSYTEDGIDKMATFVRITKDASKYAVNTPPVANAGANQNVTTGSVVTLDGSKSFDINSDKLTYTWTIASKPEGSKATLLNATTATPSFTADKDGSYVIKLIVNDSKVDSAVDTVTINAKAGESEGVKDNYPEYKYRAWGMGGDAENSKAEVTIDGVTYTLMAFSTKEVSPDESSTAGDVTNIIVKLGSNDVSPFSTSASYLNDKLVVKAYKSTTVFDETTFVGSSKEVEAIASYVDFGDIALGSVTPPKNDVTDNFPSYKYRAWGMGGDAENSKAEVTIDGVTYTLMAFSTKEVSPDESSTAGDVTNIIVKLGSNDVSPFSTSASYLNDKLVVKAYKSTTVFDETTFVGSSKEVEAIASYVDFGNIELP